MLLTDFEDTKAMRNSHVVLNQVYFCRHIQYIHILIVKFIKLCVKTFKILKLLKILKFEHCVNESELDNHGLVKNALLGYVTS